MDITDQKQLSQALEAYLQSPDFKSGIIKSTIAARSGGHYSVELFPDESYTVLWSNEIGNLYRSPGVILPLPALDTEGYEELVTNGDYTEEEFFSNQFDLEQDDLIVELRNDLQYKFQLYDPKEE